MLRSQVTLEQYQKLIGMLKTQVDQLQTILQTLHKVSLHQTQQKLKFTIHLFNQLLNQIHNQSFIDSQNFIIEFYQDNLKELRRQIQILIKQKVQNNQRMHKLKLQINQYQQSQSQDISLSNNFNNDCFKIQYRKQLTTAQSILNRNQQLISDQQKLIEQLNNQLKHNQQSNIYSKNAISKKMFQLDQFINNQQNIFKNSLTNLEEHLQQANSQIRKVQLQNIGFIYQLQQCKALLQVKNQQIKLLTKKIYESQQTINKKHKQLVLSQKLVIKLEQQLKQQQQQLKSYEQKYIGCNKQWQQKVRQKILQNQRIVLNKELEQEKQLLVRKITYLQNQIQKVKQQQTNAKKDKNYYRCNHQQIICRLQQQIVKTKNYYQQTINKFHQKNIQLQNQLQQSRENHWIKSEEYYLEKENIRKDINMELQKIISLNQKLQKKNKQLSNKIIELEKQNNQLNNSKKQLTNSFALATQTFEKLNARTDLLLKQKNSIFETKQILQNQLQKANQQILRLSRIINGNVTPFAVIEQSQSSVNKSQEKVATKQIDKSNKKNNEQKDEKERAIQKLKEQIHLKIFQNYQLKKQIKQLNQQLNICKIGICQQKDRMSYKIKELQNLLKERYSFQNSKIIQIS